MGLQEGCWHSGWLLLLSFEEKFVYILLALMVVADVSGGLVVNFFLYFNRLNVAVLGEECRLT